MTERFLSLLLFFFGADTLFEQQTCEKPPGSVIQADQSVDVQIRITVIPGTHVIFAQQPAGGVFCGKDQHHIEESPDQNVVFAKKFVDGSKGGSHAVDGEHQQRGVSHQSFVVIAVKTTQAGGEKFHSPSDETTCNKIIFHGISMVGWGRNYAASFSIVLETWVQIRYNDR